ncbi:MAG TPA: hypothetical protein DIT25_03165 [Candidatus Moranbacteria bacterium]|nr:hypothetical protein [Candidatus Moranbacteria bacterium]
MTATINMGNCGCGHGHCHDEEEEKNEDDHECCGGHGHDHEDTHQAAISPEDRLKLEEEIAKAGFEVKEDAEGNIVIAKKEE